MRRLLLVAALGLAATALAVTLLAPSSGARPDRTTLSFEPLARGFTSPVYVGAPRSQRGRLYVVEQAGRILVLVNGKRRSQPFLDLRSLIQSGGEQGLLSVAFHPRYATNHRFYVDYTDTNGDTRVVEYRSNGNVGLPKTARQLLFVDQPYANHNGGQLEFGPDARLYVGMGDGGSGGDPENRAQNLASRLGKLLTIDVDRTPARIGIAGYGLRNPWRFSFDRATGDLYIGDVGQGEFEEVDFTPRSSPGLENYGWDVFEGNARFEQKEPNGAGRLVAPIATYPHSQGCSITGGYVYRGRTLASFRGRYVYGDYCSGRVWSVLVRGGEGSGVRLEQPRLQNLSSFGEDAAGELYAVSLDGTIYRLAA